MRGTIVTTPLIRNLARRLVLGEGVPETARRLARRWAPALALLSAAPGVMLVPAPVAFAQVPGPESFQPEPRTPVELWHAVDYFVRTEQAKAAVPYLQKFVSSRPDDATLRTIRDRYGVGSFLRLADFPETRSYAEPLVKQLSDASLRHAAHPERIAQFVSALTRTPAEQTYGVVHLREAGPYAVPALVDGLNRPGLSAGDRALLVRNMGRLDAKAVPALIAALDSPDPALASDIASALGAIGDRRALPFLIIKAADKKEPAPPAVRAASRSAIEQLAGTPYEALPKKPVRILTDAALAFHRHQVHFPGDTVAIWEWDPAAKGPAVRIVPKAEAESIFARRLGKAAVDLDPADFKAKVAIVSAELEQAVHRSGFDAFPTKEAAALASAAAAGADVLTTVMRDSITDRKPELAAATVLALGKVGRDVSFVGTPGWVHPLVEALAAPSRRAQIAAARSIVAIAPKGPFPGSSRLVPVLARFVDNQPLPRGIVIDGNPNRGSQLAGLLKELDYDADTETTGDAGFRAATETGDVELILISYDLFRGSWNLSDTLSNLRSDPRTALIPIFIYGPMNLIHNRPGLTELYPGVKFVVQPTLSPDLERQMGGRPSLLSPEQRSGYAVEAAILLAKIAAQPESPFANDLLAAEPSLAVALSQPPVAIPAATALAHIPSIDAQRSLADVVTDPAFGPELRTHCATQLAGSIKRFGAILAGDQESKLAEIARAEADPGFRAAVTGALDALRARRVGNGPAVSAVAKPGVAEVGRGGTKPNPAATIGD